MKLQMIDKDVAAAKPRPLRLVVRRRPAPPSGSVVIHARRMMGLIEKRIRAWRWISEFRR